MNNASNALILDGNSKIIIHLRLRIGNSHDFMQPVEEYEWRDMEPIEVLPNDPQKLLEQRVRDIWRSAHLLPHTRNNKTLQPEDCYQAARGGDNTLYFTKPSLQTEEEKSSELGMLLLPRLQDFPPLTLANRKTPRAPRKVALVPPYDEIPVHRHKVQRGRDQLYKGSTRQKKIGLIHVEGRLRPIGFKSNVPDPKRIRRLPGEQRYEYQESPLTHDPIPQARDRQLAQIRTRPKNALVEFTSEDEIL